METAKNRMSVDMDNIEKQILGLVQNKGKSADKMTSAFKFIGHGSMEDGIKRFAKFFTDSGYNKGEQAGILKGVGGTIGSITAAFLIYQLVQYIRQQVQKKKELEEEGNKIIAALEDMQEENKTENSAKKEKNTDKDIDRTSLPD